MILINSSPRDALQIFQPFLPIYVPIGIGCILAVAEREGIETLVIDEQVDRDVLGMVRAHARRSSPPYVFGFSVLTAALKSAVELSQKLKALYPDCVICFGGIHPTAMPDEILSFPHVDLVLRGEAEQTMVELYRCIREDRDYTSIAGLSFRRDGKLVHNPVSPIPLDLDSLPSFPYHRFTSPRYDLGFVLSSRGCPYGCIFCSNRVTTGKRYRIRSADAIIDELVMLNEKYGKKQILFLDDNLLVDRKRINLLLEKIRQKGLDQRMTFSFQARGDNTNEQLLSDMYVAGFRSVFFGLETASERLMKVINKGETVAQCVEAVKNAKQIGYHVSATFIYALPGETHQDRMDCLRLSKELDIDMVRFNNATPYPGTVLHDMGKKENRLFVQGLYENFVSVSTFIENPFKPIPFSYIPEGSSEAEIRRDILFSYYRFYLSWSRLRRIFARPELGVGWFNAGDGLIKIIRNLPALLFLALMFCIKFVQLIYYLFVKKGTARTFKAIAALMKDTCRSHERPFD